MDNNNMKCKCNNQIPAGRLSLGYSTCVNCSETKQYSYIPIIANKQVKLRGKTSYSQSSKYTMHKMWRDSHEKYDLKQVKKAIL